MRDFLTGLFAFWGAVTFLLSIVAAIVYAFIYVIPTPYSYVVAPIIIASTIFAPELQSLGARLRSK